MAVNPMAVLKLMKARKEFGERHPKAVAFMDKELGDDMPEGTVIEVTVTKPGRAPVAANLKMTAEDIELMREIHDLLN